LAALSFFRYVANNLDSLGPRALDHITLVAVTMLISSVSGLGLGVAAARNERFAEISMGIASTILTIPSFALFGLIEVALYQVGDLPVIIGLILYAQLPIIRNTRTGIRAVRPAVVEAARGMGMRPHQILLRVELPLALPVILGGIRQATVMVVAIATVGAVIGSNNLGQPIVEGISRTSSSEVARNVILSGVVPVAMIGVLADAVLAGIQRLLGRGRIAPPAA
jgi:osmoprotectant transport system permease protein